MAFIAGMFAGKGVMEIIATIMNALWQGLMLTPLIFVMILLIQMKDVVIKVLRLLPLIFKIALQLLEPLSFVKDLLFGIIIGIEKLITGIINIIFGKAQESGEKIPGFKSGLFPDGVFGTSTTDPNTGKKKQSDNTKCIPPSTFRLIMMVLCPPFALFMKYGILRGWLWIILCTILTYYFYYFPGLIFASLHTLCF